MSAAASAPFVEFSTFTVSFLPEEKQLVCQITFRRRGAKQSVMAISHGGGKELEGFCLVAA